jgi:predicted nucleotidyltransferase
VASSLQSAIESITKQLIEKYKPEKIILFGSAAKGDAAPGSDADFLIIKSDTPSFSADRIMEVSSLIERDVPVDFLIYRPEEFEKRVSIGDPFIGLILKQGKVLYG